MSKDTKYKIIEKVLGFILGFSFVLYINTSNDRIEDPIIHSLIQGIVVIGSVIAIEALMKSKNKKVK